MICYELENVAGLSVADLERGNSYRSRWLDHSAAETKGLAYLSPEERWYFNVGRERAIGELSVGLAGYPTCPFGGEEPRVLFELGARMERDSLRAFRRWSESLDNCQLDAARGGKNNA